MTVKWTVGEVFQSTAYGETLMCVERMEKYIACRRIRKKKEGLYLAKDVVLFANVDSVMVKDILFVEKGREKRVHHLQPESQFAQDINKAIEENPELLSIDTATRNRIKRAIAEGRGRAITTY